MKGWKAFTAWLTRRTHTDGRDWVTLLLSLLLAFSIWLIHNLSLSYSDFISVPVNIRCGIEGRSECSYNAPVVVAHCRTTGYNFLRARRFAMHHTRIVDVDSDLLRWRGGDEYILPTKDLQEYNHIIFGENAKVEYFVSDTLVFRFAPEAHKTVPVEFIGDVICKAQYTFGSDLVTVPDSVVLYGDPHHLENITSVRTESVIRTDLDRDLKGGVRLRRIKGVRMSVDEVRYYAPVVRYVELSQSYPVKVINVPEDRVTVVIPAEVKVSFRCPFPLVSSPLDVASFHVDYSDFVKSHNGKCVVRIDQPIDNVIGWQIDPQMVECLVREKDITGTSEDVVLPQESDGRKDAELKDAELKDGEQKDGEQKDGEQKDGEQKDGEQKDGEQKDGEQNDGSEVEQEVEE